MISEKEKMIKGEIYNAMDLELFNARLRAKDLCFKFNNTLPSKIGERKEILKELLGSYDNNSVIEQTIMCDYGFNIYTGKNFYLNHNTVFLDCAPIVFGDNVFIGPNCSFYTALHPLDFLERNKGVEYANKITVGNSVWIAGSVTVLPGVSIGNNVVIGAGSVVTKDIEPNSLAVGNPCRKIRSI